MSVSLCHPLSALMSEKAHSRLYQRGYIYYIKNRAKHFVVGA